MDLFEFYRTLLFIILTVYTTAMTISMIGQAGWLLTSQDRSAAILRKYLLLMILRLRLGPLGGELLQILLLGAIFLGILWLHAHGLPA